MQLFALSDINTKLGNDYDITDENFVNLQELVGYINEAIDDSETAIHTLHHEDKYFLVPTTFSWVSGTSDYVLPSDIYGNKIRLVQYSNLPLIYPIHRVKKLDRIPFFQPNDKYEYIIINSTAGGVKARFYPTPTETSTNVILWYIRNMKRITTNIADATNICEVPECVNFVYQHVRRSLAKKTRRADMIQMENDSLKEQYSLMLDALKEMTVDEDTKIPMDLASYWDQEGIWYR